MATPDPSSLTSSADIFSSSHTLPQIRAIHKSLHVAIDDKATRLRTQVGSSYRELLGTADTIVHMRGDNEAVQELLGHMGGRCGRAVIGVKASGLAEFVRSRDREGTQERAKVRLLEGCALVVGRLLKFGGGLDEGVSRGERLVLAAKTWVLMRLLIKSLGDEIRDEKLRQEVESAKKNHRNLRRRLQRHVDKVLAAPTEDDDRQDVLLALCAYSLATSSGARDVLHYFLQKRLEAMSLAFDMEDEKSSKKTEDVIRALRLYTRSLLDVQALVPTKLSQGLASLKTRPLLADPALKKLAGLRLDIYERWCGEEIQYFTPFIRHDDLDVKQAKEMLSSWAKKGGQVLLDGLKETLEHMNEFKSVMHLRTEVLQLWIRDGGRARGFDPEEMQDELRDVINTRMLAVLDAKVRKLRLVGSEVKATLEGWQEGVTDRHRTLWDEEGYDTALASGAATFIEEVATRLHGRSDAVSKATHSYTSWFRIIGDVKEVVESLKKQRWDNDFDEIEDEETIEARQQALSNEDPEMLQKKLYSALDHAFADLEEQLKSLWDERKESSQSGAIAMFFIRVLRDVRSHLPKRPSVATFGLSMVSSLHERIAITTAASSIADFTEKGLAERTVATRPLWEGEPPLPTQSSSALFIFLRDISTAMGEAGMDLWSAAAVKVLKKHLGERLAQAWKDALAAVDEEEIEDDEKKDLLVQWAFDVSLLQCCFGPASSALKETLEAVYEETELDEASKKRITKSATDFWPRISLLFGLLA